MKIRANLTANFLGKIWIALMSILFIPFYIKLMGVESYGLVGLSASITALTALFDLGLSSTLNRELAILNAKENESVASRNLTRTLEVISWAIAILIGTIIALLAPWIAISWLNPQELSSTTIQNAIYLMSVIIGFQWISSFYSGGLVGLQRQVALNVVATIMATLRAAGAVFVLWWVEPTIEVFFLWCALISALQALVIGTLLWKSLPKAKQRATFDGAIIKRVSNFAGGVGAISVLSVFLTQVDKIILSKLVSLEMFGYYSLAVGVTGSLYYIVGSVFTAYFPRLSQLVHLQDFEQLKRTYHQSCQLMSVLIIPVSGMLIFFSADILLIWTSQPETVVNTYQLVSLLMVGTMFHGLMTQPYALQIASGRTWLVLKINLIFLAILIPIIYFCVLYLGVIGASIGWVLCNFGYISYGAQLMYRDVLPSEKKSWYLYDIGFPLLGVLVVCILAKIWFPEGMGTIANLSLLFTIGGASMIVAYLSSPLSRKYWLRLRASI